MSLSQQIRENVKVLIHGDLPSSVMTQAIDNLRLLLSAVDKLEQILRVENKGDMFNSPPTPIEIPKTPDKPIEVVEKPIIRETDSKKTSEPQKPSQPSETNPHPQTQIDIKTSFSGRKVLCELCDSYVSPQNWASHLKTQKHMVAEAKSHNCYDYSTGQVIVPQYGQILLPAPTQTKPNKKEKIKAITPQTKDDSEDSNDSTTPDEQELTKKINLKLVRPIK
jgi:hypothetical protein